ncbi:phosphatase PAP2/dual specificity phosphatase family protein [Thiosocius teredinicola]|uniref:phosphatase PAP2/dual specificity phosphatase family protein n=1 Tax=Thiosocius teredinicola TaxID=1973002 RepID=UPI000990D3C0
MDGKQGYAIQWGRSLAWLALLGPLFFISYGWSNQLAAERQITTSIVFGWEQQIPFWAWTIVPYWSIDLLYGLSFLLCRTRREVDRHALRLLTAQLIAVACFVLFPLQYSFDKPPVDGFFGLWFDALAAFDQPYNQAPSLHIALLVIIWHSFAAHVTRYWRWLINAWAILIAVSVLTTYQHHFIDVPTGALLGFVCLWLWPDTQQSPLRRGVVPTERHRRLASYYAIGSMIFGAMALFGGVALWSLWPAVSLAMVAVIYAWSGERGFQKTRTRQSIAVAVLLAPYHLAAWINSRLWTWRKPEPSHITEGVWLGRFPTGDEFARLGFTAFVDLTAELNPPTGIAHVANVPMLDLVPPTPTQLREAAAHIERLHRAGGNLLVSCALGYSRSALAVAAWLCVSGRTHCWETALQHVREQRPQVVLGAKWIDNLRTAVQQQSPAMP